MVVEKVSLPSLNFPVASVPEIVTSLILPCSASLCSSVRLIARLCPAFMFLSTKFQPMSKQATATTQISNCLTVEFNPLPRFLEPQTCYDIQPRPGPKAHRLVRRRTQGEGASSESRVYPVAGIVSDSILDDRAPGAPISIGSTTPF